MDLTYEGHTYSSIQLILSNAVVAFYPGSGSRIIRVCTIFRSLGQVKSGSPGVYSGYVGN